MIIFCTSASVLLLTEAAGFAEIRGTALLSEFEIKLRKLFAVQKRETPGTSIPDAKEEFISRKKWAGRINYMRKMYVISVSSRVIQYRVY